MGKFQDLAIALAWPEQTARGDEKWMKVLKDVGIVKNLNFKVGHAAVLLIQKRTGQVCYYDFGRYICPRGMGRARSVNFDPNLELRTIAVWKNNQLHNLKEILDEVYAMRKHTHGEGVLYCGLSYFVSFERAKAYADKVVDRGIIPYGAFAIKSNNCSRFVAQIMAKGMRNKDPRRKFLLVPNSIKPSPISNVGYADKQHVVYTYENGNIQRITMSPKEGLVYLLKQIRDSLKRNRSTLLPRDNVAGEFNQPLRVTSLPIHAQWLGGIGEGAWWNIKPLGTHYVISKFNKIGEKMYEVLAKSEGFFVHHEAYVFTYNFSVHSHELMQKGNRIKFITIQIVFTKNKITQNETKYLKIENSHG